ncbi:hypothetical protein C7389_11251 [Azoarcus indigens]|uniref:HipA-like kinase domain-containing protein n=2 Tax=Azoarcus indigens TaxID=29545 RepID=A0A4R6DVE6_9RHOO|nr:hypothetical protein C7389_11251 [Azoarcus indigens]
MIRLGQLIPGARPLGVGINGAVEGIAAFADGEHKVIAKALPIAEIATELYCSLVARELPLPVAPPALLLDPETDSLMFGSLDDGYPNFAQAVQLDPLSPDQPALARFYSALRDWAAAPEVASFDAWIDNRDRNPSNWLWRSETDWLLIDHGKALGCDPNYPAQNTLHAYLMRAFDGDAQASTRLKRAMIGAAMSFSSLHAEIARDHMPDVFSDAAAQFCAMLQRDFPQLPVQIGNLFPGQATLT